MKQNKFFINRESAFIHSGKEGEYILQQNQAQYIQTIGLTLERNSKPGKKLVHQSQANLQIAKCCRR